MYTFILKVHMYTYIYTHIYTYIYVRIYTYIRTYMYPDTENICKTALSAMLCVFQYAALEHMQISPLLTEADTHVQTPAEFNTVLKIHY